MHSISPNDAHSILITQSHSMSPTKSPSLTPTWAHSMSPSRAESMLPTQAQSMSPNEVNSIIPSQSNLSRTEVHSTSPSQVYSMIPSKVHSMSPTQVHSTKLWSTLNYSIPCTFIQPDKHTLHQSNWSPFLRPDILLPSVFVHDVYFGMRAHTESCVEQTAMQATQKLLTCKASTIFLKCQWRVHKW